MNETIASMEACIYLTVSADGWQRACGTYSTNAGRKRVGKAIDSFKRMLTLELEFAAVAEEVGRCFAVIVQRLREAQRNDLPGSAQKTGWDAIR